MDLTIVGAGPAGLAAARWAHQLGLSCTVFDPKPGGQLWWANHPIEDYVGLRGLDGPALAQRFVDDTRELQIVREAVTQIDVYAKRVNQVAARALLLAMGAEPRALGVPGEQAWLSGPNAMGLPRDIKAGQRAIVIGGGDNAVDAAVACEAAGLSVTLLARGDLRARRPDRLGTTIVRRGTQVERIAGGTVTTTHGAFSADHVFIRIGYAARSQLVTALARPDGYVEVDKHMRTSVPGVYACGDLCNGPLAASIANACGQAMVAVKHLAHVYLVSP